MHRTTTTATLLVTVAVSALTGCVTVQRPPATGPATAEARPSAPRPDGVPEPRVVQAPAREALEMIDPAPTEEREERADGQPRRAAPSVPGPRRTSAAAPEERPRRERPEAREAAPPASRKPRVEAPAVPALPPAPEAVGGGAGGNADVCALGRQYGRWRPDSPQARICEQAYGR
ncbi:hypothetical protein ACLGIH_29350 [Streptomyces sp. HMX87]|uniref:hypothetical protein n=1 Tax=Streptomyces sp. HMX87 TaxID=3390849 RepID=UPI003A898345